MLGLMSAEEMATFILEGQQWEDEREKRTQHAWMAGRLNAFHHSRRTNTGYQLKRALRSKRYLPNGQRERERRYWQIRMGQLRIDNGKEPYRITRALLDVLEAA